MSISYDGYTVSNNNNKNKILMKHTKMQKKCVYSWRHPARAAVTDLGRREFGLVAQRAAGPQRTDTGHIFRTLDKR